MLIVDTCRLRSRISFPRSAVELTLSVSMSHANLADLEASLHTRNTSPIISTHAHASQMNTYHGRRLAELTWVEMMGDVLRNPARPPLLLRGSGREASTR